MKEFINKYKTELWVSAAIVIVIFVPYFIISSGIIQSEDKLLAFDTATHYFTPLIIGALVAVIVYKAIKRKREEF